MKKYLIILGLAAVLSLSLACVSGNSGQGWNPFALSTNGEVFTVAIHNPGGGSDKAIRAISQPANCTSMYLYPGNVEIEVTQNGAFISIVYEDSCYTFFFTGTVNINGDFEATTTMSGNNLVIRGNLADMSGTLSDPDGFCDWCTYPWNLDLYDQYQIACYCD